MTRSALAPLITPEYFEAEAGPSLWPEDGPTSSLAERIEIAIEAGSAGALDAAAAAIALLDQLDGDTDQEASDEREDDREECGFGDYGIDQSEPLGLAAARRRYAATAAACQAYNLAQRQPEQALARP